MKKMTKQEFFDRLQLVIPHPKPGEADLCQSCRRRIGNARCAAKEPELIVESLDGTPDAIVRSQVCSVFWNLDSEGGPFIHSQIRE
jgi:hypothetical protein